MTLTPRPIRPVLLATAAVAALVAMGFALPSCTRPPTIPTDTTQREAVNPWPGVIAQLRKENDPAGCRRILNKLNNDLAQKLDAPQPVGHQDLDGTTHELVTAVAEQALGLAVDDHDAPTAVHNDNAIWRGLEEAAKLGFHLTPDRRVADDGKYVRPLVGVDWAQTDLDRKFDPVLAPAP